MLFLWYQEVFEYKLCSISGQTTRNTIRSRCCTSWLGARQNDACVGRTGKFGFEDLSTLIARLGHRAPSKTSSCSGQAHGWKLMSCKYNLLKRQCVIQDAGCLHFFMAKARNELLLPLIYCSFCCRCMLTPRGEKSGLLRPLRVQAQAKSGCELTDGLRRNPTI